MKAVVLREALMEGVGAVSRAAGGDALPILKNILIEASNNKLTLTGTNLEIAIQYAVSGKVIENGKVTIPARLFGEILGALRSERINLEEKGGGIALTSDSYRATFQGLPAEEFPLVPKVKSAAPAVTETPPPGTPPATLGTLGSSAGNDGPSEAL